MRNQLTSINLKYDFKDDNFKKIKENFNFQFGQFKALRLLVGDDKLYKVMEATKQKNKLQQNKKIIFQFKDQY